MSEHVTFIAEWAAAVVETIGIAVIMAFAVYTLGYGVWRASRGRAEEQLFQKVRHRLARGILLGLEFLVAADIIHTVAVELSFETVGVLAIIVLIRTFLSFTLEAEITGTWPWQGRADTRGRGEESERVRDRNARARGKQDDER
jgi:uncharacterized membrane protein